MAFTVDTNRIALFGGEYYVQGTLSFTQNTSNRTFTVTLDGVRSYSRYGYDFGQNIQVWINSSNSSTGATSKSGKINRSNSNSYTGWLPSNGLYTGVKISKTFNYNDDGSVPPVWVYIRSYNESVLWINQGVYVPVNVYISKNVSSNISPIGQKVQPAPSSVKISCTSYNATSINWSVSVTGSVTDYEVYRDGTLITTKSTTSKSYSGTMNNVTSSNHTLYARAKNSNSSWVKSNTINVDCTIPQINNPSITVSSSNKGTLWFTSNYKVQYLLDGSNLGTVDANSNPNKAVSLTDNKVQNYTLQVKRSDNTSITNSVSIKNVDTTVATVRLSLEVAGTQVNYNAVADKSCNNWKYKVFNSDRSQVIRSGTISNQSTTSVTSAIDGLELNNQYYLQVTATTGSSGLLSQSNITGFELKGCARIYTGNEWSVAIPYVFYNGEWREVVPYICDYSSDSTSPTYPWVICV